MNERKNLNRGYMKLVVWQDARELYKLTWKIFKDFPFELKKVVANQISSVDSVHRNIAEGYCRKSISEYLNFLNFSQSSLGESVSGTNTYYYADQISETDYQEWDLLAYKLENGLKKLIDSLEAKKYNGTWEDSQIVKESNSIYVNTIKY
ncbi:MAG: four helix bundle protein [Bacteroidota bacterium]|nr:four helix bundle protein [Bacteroidota bacterium]